MSQEEEIYIKIDEYLKGRLQGKELVEFEDRLQKSEDLKKKVELNKLANELIIVNRLQEVKSIYREEVAKEKKKNFNTKTGMGIVAFLVLASVLIIFSRSGKDDNNEQQHSALTTKNKTELNGIPHKDNPNSSSQKIIENIHQKTVQKPVENTEKNGQKEHSGSSKTFFPDSSTVTLSKSSDSVKLQTKVLIDSVESHHFDTKKTKADISVDVKTDTASVFKNNTSLPCEGTEITFAINTSPTCPEESKGLISISDIKGGLKPYEVLIEDVYGNEVGESGLNAGLYNVIISDKNKCSVKKPVQVTEKICPLDLHFNPFIGETLKLPESQNDGTFTVYDRAGRVYFEKDVLGGRIEEWSGKPNNGEIKSGYFIFTVRYSNGAVKKGTITITR